MPDFDVLICGAGPAGSLTAAGLAAHGYAVGMIDRAEFPRDKTCAEYCPPGLAGVLVRLGIWAEVAREASHIPGVRVVCGNGSVLSLSYDSNGGPRLGFSLARRRFDTILLDHARNRGAEVKTGARLSGIEPAEDGFRIQASVVDGTKFNATARVVVAADGIASKAATLLGVKASARWPRRLGLVTRYSVEEPMRWGEMHAGRGAYCGFAPLSDGTVTVGMAINLEEARRFGVKGRLLPSWALERLPGAKRILLSGQQLAPVRGIGPMSRRVDHVAGRGWLLVGDAAGFLDPFTGEGLYRAARGAELAVGAIHAALRDGVQSRAPDLSGYVSSRRAAFAGKERVTTLIQLALSHPNLFASIALQLDSVESSRRSFGNVLGDIAAPQELLRPGVLRAVPEGIWGARFGQS